MPVDVADLGAILDTVANTSLPAGWRKTLCYKAVEMLSNQQPQAGRSTDGILLGHEELQTMSKQLGEQSVAGLI